MEDAGCLIRNDRGNSFSAQCPAHPDRSPSLGVRHQNGRTLLRCYANCDIEDILSNLGLGFPDLFDDSGPRTPGNVLREWSYEDPSGGLIATVVRLGPEKSFRPMHINGNQTWELGATEALKTTPYALPEVQSAIKEHVPVFITEGERDADSLRALGLTATCNWGGAGKWTAEHAQYLTGVRRVNVVQDNDEPGQLHADTVVESLLGIAEEIHVLRPIDGAKDVTELIEMEIGLDGLLPVKVIKKPEDPLAQEWRPVDLSGIVDGTAEVLKPTVLRRDDEQALVYSGRVHWLSGEPESGKSWVALLAVKETLESGGRVLYVDHEDEARNVVNRLLALRVARDSIVGRFHYVNPEIPWHRAPENFEALLNTDYALCVIDGVTNGLGLEGKSISDNDDVSQWIVSMPRALARSTGAAVICCDHVTKSKDTQGRWSIGAMAKLAAVDGAAYIASIDGAPLGRGLVGHVALRIAKDRPGGVRAHCGDYVAADRTQYAAMITIDATDPDALEVFVGSKPALSEHKVFKPTAIMQSISLFLETSEDPVSRTQINQAVTGGLDDIGKAVEHLRLGKYLEDQVGYGNSHAYISLKPYREDQDRD